MTAREKAILCGLYLSKFDNEGLQALGFQSFKEAFNVMGFALGTKPASIKNYRDELDPLFPNPRQGWHQRPLREHCRRVFERYKDLDLPSLSKLVCSITDETAVIDDAEDADAQAESESFAKRLITGKSAERFFVENYRKEPVFSSANIVDMTQAGCGFDFKLQSPEFDDFLAVEVKGMRSQKGVIALTSKEYRVAGKMGCSFFLYVVKNFDETPFSENIRNPLGAGLHFDRVERRVIQISWSAKV